MDRIVPVPTGHNPRGNRRNREKALAFKQHTGFDPKSAETDGRRREGNRLEDRTVVGEKREAPEVANEESVFRQADLGGPFEFARPTAPPTQVQEVRAFGAPDGKALNTALQDKDTRAIGRNLNVIHPREERATFDRIAELESGFGDPGLGRLVDGALAVFTIQSESGSQ